MHNILLKNLYGSIRQLSYPRAFRISSDESIPDFDVQTLTKSLIKICTEISQNISSKGSPVEDVFPDDDKFLAEIMNRLWRIRQSLLSTGVSGADSGVERGYRHLERLFSFLEQMGIRIADKTGEFYDPGMAIKVVSSEPVVGIRREIIKEIVLPAVYRGDRLIQSAHVVVGLPANERQ